jgi:hypothetical protein
MTAFVEHAHEFGSAHRIATIKSKIANFWPPALIALGLVLTLTWNVGLVWLLYMLI